MDKDALKEFGGEGDRLAGFSLRRGRGSMRAWTAGGSIVGLDYPPWSILRPTQRILGQLDVMGSGRTEVHYSAV